MKKKDPLNPSHYTDGGIDTIAFIQSKLSPSEFRGFIKGNVLKYLSRERLKGGNTDLGKAAWYLTYYLGGPQCSAPSVVIGCANAGRKKRKSRDKVLVP
jgi:hypothetical protein